VRRRITILALFLVAAAIPLSVLAATTGSLTSQLDRQRAKWRTGSVSTASTAWTTIPGLRFLRVCAHNEVSATVSVTLSGGPALVRVLMGTGALLPMHPGPARFVPEGAAVRSFSYTWVADAQPFEGSDGQGLEVQWRSPSGQPITLTRGDVNVLFEQGSCP
jgi:hypothetical protein